MILSQIGWQIDIFVVCLCVMQMFRLDCIWSIFVFKFWLANMQYMVIAVLKVGSMQNWLPSQTGSCCKQSSLNSTTSVFVSVLLFQGVVGALLVKYHTVLLFLKLFPPPKKMLLKILLSNNRFTAAVQPYNSLSFIVWLLVRERRATSKTPQTFGLRPDINSAAFWFDFLKTSFVICNKYFKYFNK